MSAIQSTFKRVKMFGENNLDSLSLSTHGEAKQYDNLSRRFSYLNLSPLCPVPISTALPFPQRSSDGLLDFTSFLLSDSQKQK